MRKAGHRPAGPRGEGCPRPNEERDVALASEAFVALVHELSERVTAIGNYLEIIHRLGAADVATPAAGVPCSAGRIIDKALVQAAQAAEAVRRLRGLLADVAVPTNEPPVTRYRRRPAYRVSFLNEFVINGRLFRPCQRSIVIRSAHSREAAIEAAKKRFARLEGIPEWHIHAGMIEVTRLDDPPTGGESG